VLVLDTTNALDYLRATGRVTGPATVESLSGGVSNVVLRVVTEQGSFVLKQSCPRLRTAEEWLSDLERVYREHEVMQALCPLLPPGTVPEVLFEDRTNYVFAMSHAPSDARVWKDDLLAGHIDLELGSRVGYVLGLMHEASARNRQGFEGLRDSRVFVQLRVEPFYRKVQERRPEVAQPIEDLIERMLTRPEALCHGDYTPKNMLIHAHGFMLVDYETAYLGDQAMDLGLFLAHLLLKASRRPEKRVDFCNLISTFWTAYRATVTSLPEGLESRAVAHLGACLLARIDGTSPVNYLDEATRSKVRGLGRMVLLENVPSLSAVLKLE